jgi:hypothetical protein
VDRAFATARHLITASENSTSALFEFTNGSLQSPRLILASVSSRDGTGCIDGDNGEIPLRKRPVGVRSSPGELGPKKLDRCADT